MNQTASTRDARPNPRGPGSYVVVAASSVSAAVGAVGLPLHLNASGLAKTEIAFLFAAGAVIAIAYNLHVVPRIVARGYPPVALRSSCAGVPVGLFAISMWPTVSLALYFGLAGMLLTTMTFPQVLGRASHMTPSASQERVVAQYRQVMVAGHIVGLGVLAVGEFIGLNALLVAAVAAAVAAAGSWSRDLSRRVTVSFAQPGSSEGLWGHRGLVASAVVLPIVLIALMKAVDALRAIYLPLYATDTSASSVAVPLLFGICAATEIGVLPLLARSSARFGSTPVLIVISSAGAASFGLLIWSGFVGMVISQLVYAIFAAGFQSIGLVVLSRAIGRGAGVGAGTYVAVIQVGTMMGALLPVLVPGYGPQIFWVAAGLCIVCVALAAVLSVTRRPAPPRTW